MGRLSAFPPDRCAIGRAAGGRCDPDECPAPCGAGGSSADNTPVSLFRVLAPAADAGSVSVNACLIFGARREIAGCRQTPPGRLSCIRAIRQGFSDFEIGIASDRERVFQSLLNSVVAGT